MAANMGRHSNLQCFLDRTSVSVPSYSLPKSSLSDLNSLWQPFGNEEVVEYFNLGELWDQYVEWSAYGATIPLVCSGGQSVVQYYVPYLSAIQIYTTKSLASLRGSGEESESDSWSDDSESEKLSRSWDVSVTTDDSSFEQEAPCPTTDRLGYLYLQYIESSPPCERIPFMNRVIQLSRRHPGLISFRSVDLSPASWMSVAWYPIYQIPARKYAKDLCASFLTFHTISSCFQDHKFIDSEQDKSATKAGRNSQDSGKSISLPPFGLAAYKMQGNLWLSPENSDNEKLMSLYSAADSWLKQLRVHHHDFNFFITHM